MPLSAGRRIASATIAVPCLAAVLMAAQTPAQRPRDPAAAVTQPPAGKGLIAGTLVALDSGRPVRQGRVTLSGGDTRVSRFAVTDDSGRFAFDDLPSGAFSLSASKSGFLDITYGQKRPGSGRPGTTITLAAGQRLERVALPITRGGVITGTVYDEVGDVVYGTSVQAMRYVMRNGVRSLQVMRTATTDDRGIYRLPVLPPGEYAVVATPRDQGLMQVEAMRMKAELAAVEAARAAAVEQVATELRMLRSRVEMEATAPTSGYAPTFHPASLLASGSTTVTVDGLDERAGVDIRLPVVPLGTISGVVTADGMLPPGVMVTLYDTAETAVSFGTRTARVGPNGQFSFSGLPPGTYNLLARASAPILHTVSHESETPMARYEIAGGQYFVAAKDTGSGEMLWATATVPLAGGTSPATLNLQRGMTVSGSVAFNGPSTAAIDVSKLRLTVAPADETASRGEGMIVRDVAVTADGQFTVRGVVPGRYRVVPSSGVPPGFLIESAMFGGRDVLDFPLEVKPGEDVGGGVVTFATHQTELSGTMTDPVGKPAPGYTLILFAADGRFWTPGSRRIQSARPASDGRYAFRSLPAGDYRLIAVEDVEPGQWFDPAFLKELLGASLSVSLAPGEKRTQDIRASR
jgi:hypothetical protein